MRIRESVWSWTGTIAHRLSGSRLTMHLRGLSWFQEDEHEELVNRNNERKKRTKECT